MTNNCLFKTNKGEMKMATSQEYEAYKRYLQSLKLTPEEYEKRIKEWCRKHLF